MPKPQVQLRTAAGDLAIGELPRVVGTLSALPENSGSWVRKVPCDIVEVRLDQMSLENDWLNCCQVIQGAGVPIILTIRHESEGGKWNGSEERRLELFKQGLRDVSAVDVEFKSAIAIQVAEAAKRSRKACIVSFHDFFGTPPVAELETVVANGQGFASIVKITTMVNTEDDINILRQLLTRHWEVPLCVMGMGEWGAQSRISLAVAGSCLVYGYLDRPMAPGQMAAAELVSQLRKALRRQSSVGDDVRSL